MSDERTLHCSFCGKSQHEVAKLIAGPNTFICDECVELCNDIIVEATDGKPAPVQRREAIALRDLRLRCVELARSDGASDDEWLTTARAIATFVLGETEAGGFTISIDAAGNIDAIVDAQTRERHALNQGAVTGSRAADSAGEQ